ncbi:hypothetical protein BT93_G0785 [Corymbia citriodora subsp. variegata]|nr:hypothetical protein BT93_G0785 [Corymbia citriodora subsp. variegata]
MERLITALSFVLHASLASTLVLVVQAQPGFISIDCGAPNEYIDENTNITYKTDDGFIGSGKNMQISEMINQYNLQFLNVRVFPDGRMNCYTLRPDQGKNRKYLIRASFFYGNYDGKNQPPSFNLYIDVNYWATVDAIISRLKEIIYVPKADNIRVCLGNTGKGVPFISALELRALDEDIYPLRSGFLRLRGRVNLGSNLAGSNLAAPVLRYSDDVYDRLWEPVNFPNWSILRNTSAIDLSNTSNAYKAPREVLQTAQGTMSLSSPMYLQWTETAPPINDARSLPWAPPQTWIVYLHFMEVKRLSGPQREFTIFMNNNQFTETVSLEYLKPVVVVSPPVSGPLITLLINSTNKSSNPPILNAIELYNIGDLPNVPTAQDDVKAINDIKATYHITRESWQGDPCIPRDYTWDGLNCSYGNPPRITSLDLSNNQLTGVIPKTLADLPHLSFLNLSGNNLIGSVPEALTKRVVDNTLNMSLIGNAHLCPADLCPHKKRQKTILVTVVTSVSGFFVALFGALAIIWSIKWKQTCSKKGEAFEQIRDSSESTLRSKNRPFEYGEVLKITRNFGQVIGKGGFGKVYLGTLDNGTIVAVKMLSESSEQGYKEFQAEVRLLSVLHHGNLVSLFGYCDDSKHKALVYEYMANGNLRQHLSEDHPKVLTWSKRLQIAVDVAQGLDYLHNGCTPSIIHRDLKTSNILLNEDFQAKLADFGLSRAFASKNDSHVSTCPAGTIGYLSPEFQSSGNRDKKSDIYSFGIVLFELITGQPAIMRRQDSSDFMQILEWAIPIVESGDIQRIMDPRLQGEFNINPAWKVVEIAMSCTQQRAIERPDINHVLAELKESLLSNSSGSFQVTSSEVYYDSVPMAR